MTTFRTTSMLASVVVLLAVLLGGCGGGGSGEPASAGGETVSVANVAGTGDVLVDARGNALYSPDQEADGKVLCTDACASIWIPLTLPGGEQPTGSSDVSTQLGLIRRPDGAEQVTYKGKPLYTFAEDSSPGEVTGNGFADDFGGTSFTWHVAALGSVSGGTTSTQGGYGY
jgi:predicted lipoprotein with Yx(FWY)xxD motif